MPPMPPAHHRCFLYAGAAEQDAGENIKGPFVKLYIYLFLPNGDVVDIHPLLILIVDSAAKLVFML